MKSFVVRLCYAGLAGRAANSARAKPTTGAAGPVFGEPNPLDPAAIEHDIAGSDDPSEARRRYQQLEQDGWVERGLAWRMNPWLVRAIVLHPAGAADSLAVRPETLERMRYEWKLCEGLLGEMNAAAAALDIPLVILAIPNAHLVSARWVDFLRQRGCVVNDQMTTSQVVNDWLAEFCDRQKILCIDPLATFRQQDATGRELYLQTDDHMTPAGYALLGEALAEGLSSRLQAESRRP